MLVLPDKVTVVEVGPRDGLQSFHRWVETETKVAMIDRLSQSGLPVVEVTGFAHPRVIPHLKDAEQVCERITRQPGVVYRGLVPNARGAERGVATSLDELLGLITVSESYQKKNQNMTVAEGIEEAIRAFRIADKAGKKWVMALGMSMWCAYDGVIPVEQTIAVVDAFHNAGMRRFYLAGSVGMEDPRHVNTLFRRIKDKYKDAELGYHVHNLSGMGTANILAALDGGATMVEGAICGIGGGIVMPKTLAHVGNLPTEDIVHMLNEMGIDTGIDTVVMQQTARDVAELLQISPRSFVTEAGTRADVMEGGRKAPRAHPQ